MTRLLILAALAAGALLAWLNVRDLVRLFHERSGSDTGATRSPDAQADPMDAVQADPWPASVRLGVTPLSTRYEWTVPTGTGDVIPQPWVNTCASDNLDPHPYIDNPVLVNMRRAYGGNPLANT